MTREIVAIAVRGNKKYWGWKRWVGKSTWEEGTMNEDEEEKKKKKEEERKRSELSKQDFFKDDDFEDLSVFVVRRVGIAHAQGYRSEQVIARTKCCL